MYGLSQSQLAKAIGISPNRIAEIVNNRRRITADTALRLSLYFGNSPEFWMNLQVHYDLKMARRNLKPEDAKRFFAQAQLDADRRWKNYQFMAGKLQNNGAASTPAAAKPQTSVDQHP